MTKHKISSDCMGPSDALIARLNMEGLEPTGGREVSDLSDVDTAFANGLLRAFDGVVVTDERRSNLPFSAFLKRPANEQIVFGQFDNDVRRFLSARNAAEVGRAVPAKSMNPAALPVINVSRAPGFSFYSGEQFRDIEDFANLKDGAGKTYATISCMHALLNYDIAFISDEKKTLSSMCTAFGTWMRLRANSGITSFVAKTKIAYSDVELSGFFEFPKDIDFTDASPPADEDRIFANLIQVSVIAQVLVAYSVRPTNTVVEVVSGVR